MRRVSVTMLAVLALPSPAAPQEAYVSTDRPTLLGGGFLHAMDVARTPLAPGGPFTIVFDGAGSGLGPGADIDAVAIDGSGAFLLSTDAPVRLGAAWYEPRDVFRFEPGLGYTPVLIGAAAGIPPQADIDALATLPGGDLVLSFDAAVTVGPATYLPADLVRYGAGTFSLFWSGATAGLPPSANVDAVHAASAADLFLSFDTPVDLAGASVMPSEVVRWTGGVVNIVYADPAWGAGANLDAFCLAPGPGHVPDGTPARPGTPLKVAKAGPTDVEITWSPSCNPSGVQDYAIYEGVLPLHPAAGYNHRILDCFAGAGGSRIVTPGPDVITYYLVVPHDLSAEGSYGLDSTGAERAPGVTRCAAGGPTPGCGP